MAYVAATRAQKRILKMKNVEQASRSSMLTLWDHPEDTLPQEMRGRGDSAPSNSGVEQPAAQEPSANDEAHEAADDQAGTAGAASNPTAARIRYDGHHSLRAPRQEDLQAPAKRVV